MDDDDDSTIRYDSPREDEDEEEEDEDEEEEDDDDLPDEEESDVNNTIANGLTLIRACPNLDQLSGLRQVGKDAVCWSLSSAKPGNGVQQIRDDSFETYWQSDGAQPHSILIQFSRRTSISHVCLYLDYSLDESYTPKQVLIETGMTTQDLQPSTTTVVELQEPVGWCIIPLTPPQDPLQDDDTDSAIVHKTHVVQIGIPSMHQNGRDTHIRQVKLFGPKRQRKQHDPYRLEASPEFSTVEASQFAEIR